MVKILVEMLKATFTAVLGEVASQMAVGHFLGYIELEQFQKLQRRKE